MGLGRGRETGVSRGGKQRVRLTADERREPRVLEESDPSGRRLIQRYGWTGH